MEFSFNEEQVMFRSTVKNLIEKYGFRELTHQYINGNNKEVDKFWNELASLGFSGLRIPADHGGIGVTPLDLVPIMEEIGRHLIPGPYIETEAFAVPIIKEYGTEEQKTAYFTEIMEGKKTFSLAFCEKGGNYDDSEITLEAVYEDGRYILNGEKRLVPYGDSATDLIVPVRIKGEEGITLFIVNNENTGIEQEQLKTLDETVRLINVDFVNVSVDEADRLGQPNEGKEILQKGFMYLNAAISSLIVASIEEIIEMAVEFANTREQFGQPIGRFQAIKHKIADMKVDLELARSLTYHANWALTTSAPDHEAAILSARAFANEVFIRIAGDNIQIHGGMGFTTELDCHLYFKRAKAWENYLGSIDQHLEQTAEALGW